MSPMGTMSSSLLIGRGVGLKFLGAKMAMEAVSSDAGLVPEVTFRGEHYEGARVGELADLWLERHWMTESAHRAVRWTLDGARSRRDGRANLVGHKCVSLGAGAELSPTRAMR